MTGMRRNEVLGLKWPDIDFAKQRLHLNRGLVAVGYEVHQPAARPRTPAAPLPSTTPPSPSSPAGLQTAEFAAVGIVNEERWVFADGDGEPVHPHAVYEAFRRIVHNAGVPTIRFHDLRHTHGSLLIKDGIPVKVVSERLGHANIAFTMADLPTRPARHADRRRPRHRTPRPTRSPGPQHLGGRSGVAGAGFEPGTFGS